MNGSEVCFVGTLGRDVELRYSPSARAVANVSMAVSRRWQKDGEWQEATNWWNLTIWGEMGENAAASLVKGSRVIVTGRLEQRSYENDAGETKWVTDLIVDEIGPSLRWAQAQIERTERTNIRDENGGPKEPREPVYSDEEPF